MSTTATPARGRIRTWTRRTFENSWNAGRLYCSRFPDCHSLERLAEERLDAERSERGSLWGRFERRGRGHGQVRVQVCHPFSRSASARV